MSTSSGESTPKRHSRHPSAGRPSLPRRSTRGPLDIGESPLSQTEVSIDQAPPAKSLQPPLLSPQTSQISQYATPLSRSPRLPSPQPGSNLSNLSLTTTFRTTLTSQSHSPTHSQPLSKDFSFLLRPEIYHPLTHLDIPPPFRALSIQSSPETPLEDLVSRGHFRSAAIKAAQLLTAPGFILPGDYEQIFSLVYTRLSSLTLCNQTALAAQEVKALEDLNSSYYRDEESGAHLVHWELRVLAVRLQGMGFNDARRGVMGYYDLAREARLNLTALKKRPSPDENEEDTASREAEIDLWQDRLSELGIRVASALVEMEDLDGAARFLSTLQPPPPPKSTSASALATATPETSLSRLQMQKALLWLTLGDVEAARACILGDAKDEQSIRGGKVILALAHMGDSDFAAAVDVWQDLISGGSVEEEEAEDLEKGGDSAMYQQNLGVCLLYLGRMSEARQILESLISAHRSFHALTFNLSTIYELCTEKSRALKIGLAERIAGMMAEERSSGVGSGEGQGQGQVQRAVGWEKVNGDFKL